jgi:DNA-binding transcriptional MerR regulator
MDARDATLADGILRVGLYLGQVSAIVGISKAQLDYWTGKARIETRGKQRIYDYAAVVRLAEIKAGVDAGLSLAAAIERSRALAA